MKRILLILSILMITSVSAQVDNLKVNTSDKYITVEWKGDNESKISRFKKKGNKEWRKAKINIDGDYAFGMYKEKVIDRTYLISLKGRVNEHRDKQEVRIVKIFDVERTSSKVNLDLLVYGKFKNVEENIKVYITKNNIKCEIIGIDEYTIKNGITSTKVSILLPGDITNDEWFELFYGKAFMWFKSKEN